MIGVFVWLINSFQGGSSRIMQFGKAKAKMHPKDAPKVTFADVAGADEAIEELREIKEFLENPAKFAADRREDPEGRAAVRASGNRQDPAGPGRRR